VAGSDLLYVVDDPAGTALSKSITVQALADFSAFEVVDDLSPQLGGNLDINGKFINGSLISDTDGTDNIGSSTVRHDLVFGRIPNFLDPGAGTNITPTLGASYGMIGLADNSNGGTVTVDIGGADGGTWIGGLKAGGVGSTARVDNNFASAVFGSVKLGTGVVHGVHELKVNAHGSIAGGMIDSSVFGSLAGQACDITAGSGSIAFGTITPINGGVRSIKATGAGAFAMGRIFTFGTSASIEATGSASFAMGDCQSSGAIKATSLGTFAFGSCTGTGSITAIAAGSFAGGASFTGGITASGQGSFAWANVNVTPCTASGTNAVQFGPGTNAQIDSLQVGIAGTGIAIKGTNGAFTTPANGQIYTVSGDVRIRSNAHDVSVDLNQNYTITVGSTLRTFDSTSGNYTLQNLADAFATFLEDHRVKGQIN
jgi:hypothetical protein